MSEITLLLKAKYFENADYCDNQDCPVARAIKEQMNGKKVAVFPYYSVVDGRTFFMEYTPTQFGDDHLEAMTAAFDAVIREIILKN